MPVAANDNDSDESLSAAVEIDDLAAPERIVADPPVPEPAPIEQLPATGTDLCDAIRSYAPGFIFTTSLAPAIAAGAVASIRHLKTSGAERERQQERVRVVKARLTAAGLPVIANPSHIVPLLVGDPVLAKRITDALLERFAIYVQPINYPTVPRGTERLRLTPSPQHSDADIDRLVAALTTLWTELALPFEGRAQAAE